MEFDLFVENVNRQKWKLLRQLVRKLYITVDLETDSSCKYCKECHAAISELAIKSTLILVTLFEF